MSTSAKADPMPAPSANQRPDLARQAVDCETLSVDLASGRLTVQVDQAELPLKELCGFASRRNPRRGFLFVSKVLGRHIPVDPEDMRRTYRLLAQQIPHDLPGPVLMIGMAETAIGLGHGVHEEYVRQSRREDALYLSSTRYVCDQELLFHFEEPHSHASGHIVYLPADPDLAALCRDARSLILIDDERSTGTTFANLAAAARKSLPKLEVVRCSVLTDWSGGGSRPEKLLPAYSLLRGSYSWTTTKVLADEQHAPAVAKGQVHTSVLSRAPGGRRGCVAPLAICDKLVDRLANRMRGQSVLVLGTGEFVHPPFLLAEALAGRGIETRYQSTTRSPIRVGHDIRTALRFTDNYGDGIANYLYNATPEAQDKVVIAHETPAELVDRTLVEALNAELVDLGDRPPNGGGSRSRMSSDSGGRQAA